MEQKSGVGNSAVQRADEIKEGRERNDARGGDAADAGLEADDAAERRRDADGAARVSANGPIAEAGSNGCCGAAAGTAGYAGEVPWIARRAVMRIVGGDAVGEFVEVGFAEEDGAGFSEF